MTQGNIAHLVEDEFIGTGGKSEEDAMTDWPPSDDDLRVMYAGGHGNATARRFSRFWAVVQSAGLLPRRWVTLEVIGRRSGRVIRFPLGMADWEGNWYLVSMLGDDCNWVRNVRAAGGQVTIRHGRGRACRLVEVPIQDRAAILRRYLQKVPGARPHVPVDQNSPLAEFEVIAARYPAFRVEAVTRGQRVDTPGRRSVTGSGQSRSSARGHWVVKDMNMTKTYRLGTARRAANVMMTVLIRIGVVSRSSYLLTTTGRNSGKLRTTPVTLVNMGEERWLVSPYGTVSWVHNVRTNPEVRLRRGRRTEVLQASEVDANIAGPVLQRYVRQVKVTAAFFDAAADDLVTQFVNEASRHPVFRLTEIR